LADARAEVLSEFFKAKGKKLPDQNSRPGL
jgi:hypothetical protein